MDSKGVYGINEFEGLEVIRRRPSMYIGPAKEHLSPRARLLECLVNAIAHESSSSKPLADHQTPTADAKRGI